MWIFIYSTNKIEYRSRFETKQKNSVKKRKPMFQRFLRGHGPQSSSQGR